MALITMAPMIVQGLSPCLRTAVPMAIMRPGRASVPSLLAPYVSSSAFSSSASRPTFSFSSSFSSSVVTKASFASEKENVSQFPSEEFRIFQKAKGVTISAWHDVPLFTSNGLLNFLCEIPKETSAKMELATTEANNPIKQDMKKGKLRYYPYNINWNYGMLPQTWEDPAHKIPECQDAGGDCDPVDVVEIGSAVGEMGSIYPVKPLGVYAMIDSGEVDWKVICIRADDPKASLVNDVEDVEREFPGELQRIFEWFRDYKIPDGKPANEFGYDNKCMNKEFALKVINETHGFYNALRSGARENTEDMCLF